MRKVLLVSSLLLAAVACDRDNTSKRTGDPIPPAVALPDDRPTTDDKQIAPDTTEPANPSAGMETTVPTPETVTGTTPETTTEPMPETVTGTTPETTTEPMPGTVTGTTPETTTEPMPETVTGTTPPTADTTGTMPPTDMPSPTDTAGTMPSPADTTGTTADTTGTAVTTGTSDIARSGDMAGSRDTGQPGTTGSTGTAASSDPWNSPAIVGMGTPPGTEGTRESATPSGTGPTGTGPSDTVARSSDHAISCEQLIPRAVQQMYLADMTITPTSHATDIAVSCRIEGPGVASAANAQAWCNPGEKPSAAKVAPPSTPTKSNSVGKAAILVDAGEMQQLVAWDSDSSCQITLEVPKTVDAVALGRQMLEALPAKSG